MKTVQAAHNNRGRLKDRAALLKLLTLYTLTSVYKLSVLFSKHFLRC